MLKAAVKTISLIVQLVEPMGVGAKSMLSILMVLQFAAKQLLRARPTVCLVELKQKTERQDSELQSATATIFRHKFLLGLNTTALRQEKKTRRSSLHICTSIHVVFQVIPYFAMEMYFK